MNYKMIVTISDPETKKGMNSTMVMDLRAEFSYNPETYGNGYYLAIYNENKSFLNSYDLRYDDSFHKHDKLGFLASWAANYWTGTEGAYKIDKLTIEHLND